MSGRLYVSRLPYEAQESDLRKFFYEYGKIKKILIYTGYALVEFYDPRDADNAIQDLNDKELLGRKLLVKWAMRKADLNKATSVQIEYRLIVENLSRSCHPYELKKFMEQAGKVAYVDKTRIDQGIVEFTNFKDMKNAINKLNRTKFKGKHIRLMEDPKSKNERDRSRSSSPETSGEIISNLLSVHY
ncbi:unnamed protein product [Brassicogethes aeneus]|uniref:RRM domain-containing protein n=1 Tax=Brassicogethes aeneus TaxID=1431903 RepID=A0A9P0BAZ3_BRAAE|nr:unnamed protein product [Brassicogethes aeneus]